MSETPVAPDCQKLQFSLAKVFALVTVACVGAALISRSPVVGGAAFVFVVTVVSCTAVANRASAGGARELAIAGQVIGVAVNVLMMCVAARIAFVGVPQATSASVLPNTIYAIAQFGLLIVGAATCTALVATQRVLHRMVLAIAYAGNGILLAIALIAVTQRAPRRGNIQLACLYYGLALISVTAMSVRAAYLKRRNRGCGTDDDASSASAHPPVDDR
jgi:hypothetical protein